jgi:hypothetical protein
MFKQLMIVAAIFLSIIATTQASPITVTYIGGAQYFEGNPVGPVSGTIDGIPVDLFCIQYNQYVNIGQEWQAEYESVLPDTLHARAAWLFEQIPINLSQIGSIQYAAWNLFYAGAPDNSESISWQALSVGKNPEGNWLIVSHPKIQDFLTPGNQVPEPSTYALGACGILFLIALKTKRE